VVKECGDEDEIADPMAKILPRKRNIVLAIGSAL